MKQSVSRQHMEAFAVELERVKTVQAMSPNQFDNLHRDFRVEDTSGNTWTVGIHTRKWHQLSQGQWVAMTPPESFFIEDSLLKSLKSLPRGPQTHGPASPGSDSGKVCPNCGASLSPGKKFCTACGSTVQSAAPSPAPSERVCKKCSERVPASKKFCPRCGAPMA